jgi:heat shock protein HslJ
MELHMQNKHSNMGSILGFWIFGILAISSCVSGASVKDGGKVFADIQGREWILAEIQGPSGSVRLDRQKLDAGGFEGVYTVKFDTERVSGMGAPNRYFGPYTQGEGRALTIGNVAGTLMAPLREPEELKEHEYFALLGNVSRWDFQEGHLKLFTVDAGGHNTVLVFQ